MAFKPTISQQNVLDTKKQKVVVSASAGSGKTTLMIEKILKIIIEDGADISKFLVCTFTNASSAEMKERLYSKMAECIASEKDEKKRKKLIENYEKIELAKICTIDKLCLDVVKKYYYKLKIDANIQTLSTFEASFLKNRAFKLALNEFEKVSSDGVELICAYFLQDRSDEKLQNLVYSLYDDIQTRADGFDYLDNVALTLYSDNVENSVVFNAGVSRLDVAVQGILKLYLTAVSSLDEKEDSKAVAVLNKDIDVLKSYFNFDLNNKINFLFKNEISATRFPNGDFNFKDEIKAEKKKFKGEIEKLKSYFGTDKIDEMMMQLRETKQMLVLLIDFLKIFKQKFDDLKLKQNQFEFLDIQHLALRLFRFDDVLNDFTSDINYVFVDEFQDVNYLQDSLIENLSRSGKLFLVGDAKQSIYGFRLCTPAILMQKIKDFAVDNQNGLSENLNENFRSDKCILDFVNQIFNCIMTESESGVDYEGTSKLKGKDAFDNGEKFGDKVEINILDFGANLEECEETSENAGKNGKENGVDEQNKNKLTQFENLKKTENACESLGENGQEQNLNGENNDNNQNKSNYNFVKVYDIAKDESAFQDRISMEANFIVQKVALCLGQTIYDAKAGCVRTVDFKDIAILFRKRKALYVKVVQLLKAKGFPVSAEFKEDIYQSIEVMFINSLLKLVLNFEDDISLATVLTFPCIGLDDSDLSCIRLFAKSEEHFSTCVKLFAMQFGDGENCVESEKCEDSAKKVQKNSKKTDFCNDFGITNENCTKIANKINNLISFLKELKNDIYVCNVYEIIKKIEKHYDLLNVLYAMKDEKIISNYEKFLNEIIGLKNYNLIDYLQYLQTRNNGGESESEISVSSGDNCITCQTIHASKGLEYPIVILASAGDASKYRGKDLVITNEGIGADFYNIEEKWKKPTLVKNYIESAVKRSEIEEMKRLLYVALTRPKNQLIVVGACSVKKFEKEFREYAEPSFMQMILSYLKPFEREILVSSGKLDNEFASIKVVFDIEMERSEEKEKESGANLSDEQLNFICSYLNYSYPHLQNQNYAFKNSVSSILKSENVGENFCLEPQNLEISEHLIALNEIGTIYHSVLEQIDFINADFYDDEKIDALLEEMKKQGVNVDVVNAGEILDAIKNIKSLIECGDTIRKEQPFIFKARHCDIVESKCEEEVLVQGVIDLLIIKPNGNFIIVDYKNTAIKDKERLINKYKKQLFLYSYAVKLAYKAEKVQTYLYSIKQNQLIEVK